MLPNKKQPERDERKKKKMEILRSERELEKALKGLTSKDIKKGYIDVTIYTTPTSNAVNYDVRINIEKKNDGTYNEENYIYYYKEKSRVGGGGYDRWSTALSNALNLCKTIYKRKTTLKVKGDTYKEFYTKDGRRVYGLYKDNSISYGIGVDAVLYAVYKGFSNVKCIKKYNGRFEDCYKFEIVGR